MNWKSCKKILCIRPDNMGDVLMSGPAIRALKESFECSVTLLTSSMAADIVPFMPEINEVMVFNAPWVKLNGSCDADFFEIVKQVKEKEFDAAVVFTVFSQNPLPSAMIPYLAGIPERLGYCRENPYDLFNRWVPEQEPYHGIQHQVQRDLQLVGKVGAHTGENSLRLIVPGNGQTLLKRKLDKLGLDPGKPWLIMHAGASELKRQYPAPEWISAGRQISEETKHQLILTGNKAEWEAVENIKRGIGKQAFNAAGALSMEEFILLMGMAPLVITVNTATAHIAAATSTPLVVLYALTNPQHLPWKAKGKVLLFEVPSAVRSKNSILQYVQDELHPQGIPGIQPADIAEAAKEVLESGGHPVPVMVPLRGTPQHVLQG